MGEELAGSEVNGRPGWEFIMAWEYEFQDESGTAVHSLVSCKRFYLLPDGKYCRILAEFAWCENCKAYVNAERVPTVQEIDSMLNDLRAGPSVYGAKHQPFIKRQSAMKAIIAAELLHWNLLREWRLLRREERPRCLVCSSTSIHSIPNNQPQVIDPRSGRRLFICCRAQMRMVGEPDLYNVEGERLTDVHGEPQGL